MQLTKTVLGSGFRPSSLRTARDVWSAFSSAVLQFIQLFILLTIERAMRNIAPFDQPAPDDEEFAENASIRPTWASDWHVDDVRSLACKAKDFNHKWSPGHAAGRDLGDINRWTLNFLRHRYTNYDSLLWKFGRESPYVAGVLRERVTAMTLRKWPDLADLASDAKWCRRRNLQMKT